MWDTLQLRLEFRDKTHINIPSKQINIIFDNFNW